MTTEESRSDFTGCYFCGEEETIEQHHILPQRFDGSDRRSNIVDLCHDCHWKLERLYNKDFWNAVGVKDPRATKESHLTCEHHSCLNQAVGAFHTSAGPISYRCEDHKPGNTANDVQIRTTEGVDEDYINRNISQIKLICKDIDYAMPNSPYSNISDPRKWERQNKDTLLVYNGQDKFKAKKEDDEWSVSYEGYRNPDSE